jgi:hypothetical protein
MPAAMKSIETQVRALLPTARQLLEEGIGPERLDETISTPSNFPDVEGAQMDAVIKWANAHYLLGIAVGLSLNPATFLKGGAR